MMRQNPNQNLNRILSAEPGQMVLGFFWMRDQSRQFFKTRNMSAVQPNKTAKYATTTATNTVILPPEQKDSWTIRVHRDKPTSKRERSTDTPFRSTGNGGTKPSVVAFQSSLKNNEDRFPTSHHKHK